MNSSRHEKKSIRYPQTPIPYYDRLMTRERAIELQAQVSADLDRALAQKDYQEVFVNLGKTYLLALTASQELSRLGNRVQYAQGGIGKKMAQMKRWLFALPPSPGPIAGAPGNPSDWGIPDATAQPSREDVPASLQKGSGHV